MRTYPCYLKSKASGSVYLFERQGTLCTLYVKGVKSSGNRTIGQKIQVGSNSEDKDWWEEYQVTYKYDPSQAGDTDEDI